MLRMIGSACLLLTACAAEPAEAPPDAQASGFRVPSEGTAAVFLSCMEGKAAIVGAHRGGPAPGFPENALETIEETLAKVPALIEVDVRRTRDGAYVLMHDETVDRTTTGSGRVDRMDLAELQELRLVDEDGTVTPFGVPTLQDALAAARGRTVLQLDVKRGVGLEGVVQAVEQAGAEAHAAIITYTDGGALLVARASNDVSVVATVEDLRTAGRLNAAGLGPGRLIAWTGIVGRADTRLWDGLGEDDIPASGGALGRLDELAADGRSGVYRTLERAGLDIIATDTPVEAATEIGANDTIEAARACMLPSG